jgi:endonuclease YncB( thermonuclease family)
MIYRALSAAIILALTIPAGQALPQCVDINTASRGDLRRIVRIDEVRSAEAIELRKRRPFDEVRDLMRIKGIGPSRILDIEAQGLACVGGEVAGRRPEIAGPARTIDGDTLAIADEHIRLIGMDAPEEAQICQAAGDEWPCRDRAADTLAAMIGTGRVRCEVYGRDRYQRALAVCFVGAVELNSRMAREGFALPCIRAAGRFTFDRLLLRHGLLSELDQNRGRLAFNRAADMLLPSEETELPLAKRSGLSDEQRRRLDEIERRHATQKEKTMMVPASAALQQHSSVGYHAPNHALPLERAPDCS